MAFLKGSFYNDKGPQTRVRLIAAGLQINIAGGKAAKHIYRRQLSSYMFVAIICNCELHWTRFMELNQFGRSFAHAFLGNTTASIG